MGAGCQPGNLLIVTEIMPKGSVHDLLRNTEIKLSFKRKMLFAKDAALGVNYLHRSTPKFLHMDLKAANLLVDENWNVKVADFGLSVVKKNPDAPKEKHGPIGTPLWMAPEVLMNKLYDEKADVYSFGIVLWELLSARDPWEDIESLVDLVEAVCIEHRRPPLPKDIPTSLKDLVNNCWHASPERRPSFEEIWPRFDEIIIDGLLRDPQGRTMWRQNFLGKTKVKWGEFTTAFAKCLSVEAPKENDMRFDCLRAVTGKKQDQLDGIVTIESFSGLLEWFGPISQSGFLDRVVQLLQLPCFFGDISALEAEDILKKQKSPKGLFILRFSTREPGSYALTVHTGKNGPKHYRITHKAGKNFAIGKIESKTLAGLLKRYAKELGLKKSCPGSKLHAIVLQFQNNQQTESYQSVDG